MADMSEEDKKEIETIKNDKEFMEYMKSQGYDEGYFDLMPKEIKEAYDEYKSKKGNEQNKEDGNSQPAESKQDEGKKDELNVGGEEQNAENGENINRDEASMSAWGKWAKDHNYLFEDTKEEGWEYSFNLYKNKEDMEAKNPSSTIKGKGDSLIVKSDDLEVYREIARQAKEKGYTAINLRDKLSPQQIQMMSLAALELGIELRGNTQKIDLNNEIFKDLGEETKQKVDEYNAKLNSDKIEKIIDKAIEDAKKSKMENPDASTYDKKDSPMIKAIAIYATKKAGYEPTGDEFVNLPAAAIKELPSKHKKDMLEALASYNTSLGTKLAEQAKEDIEKLYKGEKVAGIERITSDGEPKMSGFKITEKDPMKRALLFATVVESSKGAIRPVFEPAVENVAAGVPIQYLPKNLSSILLEENYEARKRQRDEIIQRREKATGKDKEYFEAHKKLRDKGTSKEDKESALEVVKKYQEEKHKR